MTQLRFFRTASLLAALLFFAAAAHAKTVLVTGSSRSHGLAFVSDYAERGWTVIATTRTPSEAVELNELAARYPGRIFVEELDVTDFAEVDALAEKYEGTPIDVLNLNGAINTFRVGLNEFGETDYAWLEQVLRTNIIGQLYTAEAFLEHVAASEQKTIAVMSAVGGSITNVNSSTAPSYRASKAGLNMLMRTYGEAVKDRGVIVAIIAPGTIDTKRNMEVEDLSALTGRERRLVTANAYAPRAAIGAMIDMIDRLTIADIDKFHKWDGTVLPW